MLKISNLGEGVYGKVYKIRSTNDGKEYAFKRNLEENTDSFSNITRELSILKFLNNHPRVVTLKMVSLGSPYKGVALSPPNGKRKDDSFHFVFELASCNLTSYLEDNSPSFEQVLQFIVDILIGVDFINRSGVIHRDLKPCNIVVFNPKSEDIEEDFDQYSIDEDVKKCSVKSPIGPSDSICDFTKQLSRLKMCDFGLSNFIVDDKNHTPGVVTLTYRAPEILKNEDYNYKVDCWSVGCIIYEIVFDKSFIKNELKKDSKIFKNIEDSNPQCKGVAFMKQISTNSRAKRLLAQISKNKLKTQENICEVLDKLLDMDPKKRVSAYDCLDLPLFDSYRNYINQNRKVHGPRFNLGYKYSMIDSDVRKECMGYVNSIYSGRYDFEWYSHRKLFHAIDIFDRILRYKDRNGEILSLNRAEEYFFCSLILSIKHFTSLVLLPDLTKMLPNTKNTNFAKLQIEIMRDIFEYNLYRYTAYEAIYEHFQYYDNKSKLIEKLLKKITDNKNLSNFTPKKLVALVIEEIG
jgi:p38 MAP kinase